MFPYSGQAIGRCIRYLEGGLMPENLRIVRTAALMGWLFLVTIGTTSAAEWGVVSPSEWAQGAPPDYPEADAIVLRDSSYVYMADISSESPDGFSFRIENRRHIRKKVLTPAGIDRVGNAQFEHWKRDELVELKAQTIFPDGTTIPVPEDQFFTKEVGDFREKSFAFLQVDSGCIVEYTYTTTFNGYMSSWQWTFGKSLFTLESVFCLQVSGGFQYSYATSNVPDGAQAPTIRTESVLHQGETNVYTWRMHNILPLVGEPYMSSIADYTPRLIVQMTRYRGAWFSMDAARSWEELGEQFDGYLGEYCNTPGGFKKHVRDLTRKLKSDYDKSRAIYDHVVHSYQRTGDYFTLDFKHDRLGDVYDEHNGTPAEKNILLWRMLKQAGVDAWPVLISTRDHGQLPPGVFRTDQFNHLIVFAEVEQGGIYLDATSAYCPYGMLPSQCRTEAGLMIDRDNSSLVRIVTSQPMSLRADFSTIYLDANGNAVCSLTSVFTGYLAIDFGSEYEETDPEEFIKDEYLDNPSYEYELEDYSCTLDSAGRLMVTSVLSVPRFATLLGDQLLSRVYHPMFGYNPFVRDYRLFPIDFKHPMTYQHIARIYAPEGYRVVQLPEAVQYTTDGLTYSRIPQPIEGGAAWESKLEIGRERFDVEEYSLLRDFFDKTATAGQEEILFSKGE